MIGALLSMAHSSVTEIVPEHFLNDNRIHRTASRAVIYNIYVFNMH